MLAPSTGALTILKMMLELLLMSVRVRHKLYHSSWGIKDLNLSVFLFRIAALKVKESSKAEFKKKRTNKKYAL